MRSPCERTVKPLNDTQSARAGVESAAVTVVIPNYDGTELLRACLTSLKKNTVLRPPLDFSIVVVDDGSPQPVRDALSGMASELGFSLVQLEENRGFAPAVNAGLAEARGEYVLLVNNDVTFEYADWLQNALDCMEREPRTSVVGVKLLYPDNNLIQHAGLLLKAQERRFYPKFLLSPAGDPGANVEEDVAAVTGALMLLRREMLDEIGLLDEDLALSYEDVDLCLRAREAGWRVRYCPSSVAIHHEGATRGNVVDDKESPYRELEDKSERAFWEKWSARLAEKPHLFRHGTPRERTLVVRPGTRKDVLMATPVLKALKAAHPDAELVVHTRYPEVLVGLDYVDATRTDDRVMIEPRDRLIELMYENSPLEHPVRVYAAQAGLDPGSLESLVPEVAITEAERELARRLVADARAATPGGDAISDTSAEADMTARTADLVDGGLTRKAVALHTGRVWSTRAWPQERFAALARRLAAEEGLTLLQVGDLGAPYVGIGADLRGRLTIQQAAAIIAEADVFVGVDSLPSHLAQVVGTRAAIIYGCIDPALRMHRPELVTSLYVDDLECKFCHHRLPGPREETVCYRDRTYCLEGVTVDRVVEAVRAALSAGRN